jgi:hypothetical protein
VIRLKRATIICLVLWLIVFLAATSFSLLNIHAPTPDEANDIQQARLFSLQPSTFFNDQMDASVNKNAIVSLVLNRQLHVIYVSLSMLVSNMGSISAYAAGAFEVSMLVLATYACAETIFGNSKIALVSALIMGLNPVVFQVGIGVLTDVSVALYLIIGFVFYSKSFKWGDTGQVTKIDLKLFTISLLTFSIALLIKTQTFLFFFTFLAVNFLFILFKSRKTLAHGFTVFKYLTGLITIYLSIDLYFVLGTYFFKTLPGISMISRFLVTSFFENLYQLIQPSAYALASSVLPLSSITSTYIAERLYLSIFSPNYLTFAIFFLFFAGIVTILAVEKGQIRNYSIFLITLFASPIAISLLRPTWELARGVIFLYPFIIMIAVYGLFKAIPRKNLLCYLTLCIGFTVFVFSSEYFLVLNYRLIPGGILSAYITLPTFLLFLPSLPIIIWKLLSFNQTQQKFTIYNVRSKFESLKLKWKKIRVNRICSRIYFLMVPVSIIVICSSSLFLTDYYTSISFRHQVSPAYEKAAFWLDSHVLQGDSIMSNNFFLNYFVNDSTLLKVSFNTIPGELDAFKEVGKNVTYIVLFTQEVNPSMWETNIPFGYKYAFTASVNPPNNMTTVYQYPDYSPIVRIYAHIAPD